MPSTSTPVQYVWRRDADPSTDRPDIKPMMLVRCGAETGEDESWFTCTLARDHAGPHAMFDRSILLAAWFDRPTEADRHEARMKRIRDLNPLWSDTECETFLADQADEYAADEAGAQ